MRKIALFGAGAYGQIALKLYQDDYKREVACFIDNNPSKRNTLVLGVPVISLEEYLKQDMDFDIVVCADYKKRVEIGKQLEEKSIYDYENFNERMLFNKERVLSWSDVQDNEDIILYHVLHDEKQVFWIDVGCNDPDVCSVTKLFYDKGSSGINIDLNAEMIALCEKYRIRDININIALGEKAGDTEYVEEGPCGAWSSLIIQEKQRNKTKKVEMTTLAGICEEYVNDRPISFLKIDVEGYEKEVLSGADFQKWRPKIMIIESTIQGTLTPSFEGWEPIVLENGYHFVYSRGVNRYYVADEESQLDRRFVPWTEIASKYYICHASPLYCV